MNEHRHREFFPGEPHLVAPNVVIMVCDKCGALVSSHYLTDHIAFHAEAAHG